MSDIDEIKSRLNIVEVIGKRVTLKKAGRNFKGLCPFHNEKSPSFVVSPDRQIWHCFGCGKGGTIFDFVMEYEHIDFAEALEELADLAGVKLTRKPTDAPEVALKQKLYSVNHLASEFYHYILTKHTLGEKARTYLKSRGVTDKSIATFGLGYSPNGWDALTKFLHKKGYDDNLLVSAGLATRGRRVFDRFRGRVMFTLKDHRGNVVGFAGRQLEPDDREGKYINTSETPVYVKSNVLYGLDVTKAAIQKEGEAIVMEGELDVISSFQAGIGNAVAIKGSALTEGHVRLLKRYTERLVFALDSDMAGDAASRRGIEIADRAGMDMRVVSLPSGKDPDEAARENPSLLKKAIKDAVPVYDYFITSALARFDGATAYGKKKISEELLPVLAKIENPIVQGHYVKKLAETLETSEETVAESLKKTARTIQSGRNPTPTTKPQEEARTRPEKLEVYLLAFLLQGKTVDLFEDLDEAKLVTQFFHPAAKRIIEALREHFKMSNVFLLKDFADSLPKELLPTLDEAFLWDMADIIDDEERFSREWLRALHDFERIVVRRKIHDFTRELSAEGIDHARATNLQKELAALSVRLKDLEK